MTLNLRIEPNFTKNSDYVLVQLFTGKTLILHTNLQI